MEKESSVTVRRAHVVAITLLSVAVGVWVFWRAIDVGLYLDDYLHLAKVQGQAVLGTLGRWNLFTFAQPGPDPLGPIQGDFLPWWHHPELRLHFFRPLAVATYHVDHALFGSNPTAFHASSLVWYAGVIAGCVWLYALIARETGRGPWTVLLAGVIFAAAREHEGSIGWLAGRYTLVSTFFCPLAMLAYHRWRSSRSRAALAWSLAWLTLGLLGSEVPVAFFGFFLAYEVSLASDSWPERVRGILPVVLLYAAWFAFYVASGYGTEHTEWYVNPITQPAEFVQQGLGRNLPQNFTNILLPAAAEPEWARHIPGLRFVVALFEDPLELSSWLVIVLFAAFAAQAFVDRGMRFALVGTLLALLPMSAAPVQQRVLLVPTIGGAWIFASFVAGALGFLARPAALRRPWNAVRLLLAVGILGALTQEVRIAHYRLAIKTQRNAAQLERALILPIPDEVTDDMRVILVTVKEGSEALYLPILRAQQGLGWPGAVWGLYSSSGTHELTRTGDTSFRLAIRPEERPKGLMERWGLGLYRDEFGFRRGQEFQVGALHVTVADVDEKGAVHAVDVEIDRSLDDPDVYLIAWEAGEWVRLELPFEESVITRP